MDSKHLNTLLRYFTSLVLIALLSSTLPGTVLQAAALTSAGTGPGIGNYEVQPVLMAIPGGMTSGLCESWANACELSYALTSTVSGQQIWVAAGTYKPTTDTDRLATFRLKVGIAIYGGFAGTETALSERNPVDNVTILSGDLNGDDVGFTNNSENVYHVVTGADNVILDGFTIMGGNANGTDPHDSGGGMYNRSRSNATLTNITFSGNMATAGGAMHNEISHPALTNVTFINNSANMGGAMNNVSSHPTLTNVTFSGNEAGFGGAIYDNSGSPILTNVTFSGNVALANGGAMGNDSYSYPVIHNTIFWGNTAGKPEGAQFHNDSSIPVVSDSIIQGGCPAESTCTNIITDDPLLGTLGNNGGYTQTIPILPNSSAIDTGDDTICPATDQRGITRPQGAHCDIGAYEALFVDTTPPSVTSITRVDANPTDLANVNFAVTFSEAVTGVDVTDFVLTVDGGITGATIVSATGTGQDYFVSVNTGTGDGTLRLDLVDDDSILDSIDNPLGGPGAGNGNFTTGETYTINRSTPSAPTVTSSLRADPNPTAADMVSFTVSFSEAVTGVDTSDFPLTTTGALSGALVANVGGSGNTYTVIVATGNGDGGLRLDVSMTTASRTRPAFRWAEQALAMAISPTVKPTPLTKPLRS